MAPQVAIVFGLTFVIHLVGTLAYALRIAGVRTGRVAVSFALFNVLMLLSRTANTFQGPLLAKHVEGNILRGTTAGAEADFRWLLAAAPLATLTGALLLPTAQRMFAAAIESFARHRSVPRLLWRGLSPTGLRYARAAARAPARENLTRLHLGGAPLGILCSNVLATALITVGVFASLHAGYLHPELRVTANNLSPVVNALSTVLLFVWIDPYLSILSDDVVAGRATDAFFRRAVVLFVGGRLLGTLLAQLLLLPAAEIIVAVAKLL
ncbi:MAG: lipid II flippase Amj family protein [Acidobacteriota bacterium]|nr:lipid II flippase Amj family protein [Acidobacteriota bacterium]